MIEKKDYPILEFDSNKKAQIEPSQIAKKKDVPEECVITFFGEAINKKKEEGKLKQISRIVFESITVPVYVTEYEGREIGLVLAFLGAAGCAGELEELIAMGFKKFIVCGGAGVLKSDIDVGQVFLVNSAVRDEGLSYHYLEPSREVEAKEEVIKSVEETLKTEEIPYEKVKTWTTDAFYRETKDKIKIRREEGCTTVEMEAAALLAVAKFRDVQLGQLIYAGDDLSGEEWNLRGWKDRGDIRGKLVELSMKCCMNL